MPCLRSWHLSLKSEQPVSFLRTFAFLFLAFAVFGLGLQARLALYKANSPVQITSAKLSTEKRSAEVLKSLEVRRDDSEPATQIVLALLFSGLYGESSVDLGTERVDAAISNPTRSQLSCITSLRRPPPPSFI